MFIPEFLNYTLLYLHDLLFFYMKMNSYCRLLVSVQLLQGICKHSAWLCFVLLSHQNKMTIFILVAVCEGIMAFLNSKEKGCSFNSRLFSQEIMNCCWCTLKIGEVKKYLECSHMNSLVVYFGKFSLVTMWELRCILCCILVLKN